MSGSAIFKTKFIVKKVKKLKAILSISFLLITICVYSQTPVGLKYDINAQPFDGYFDPFTYSSEEKLTVKHNSGSYEIGYYYDRFGNKKEGLIKFEHDKIMFKKGEFSLKAKIKPSEVKSMVIGVDSFFVATNFYYKKS